MNSNNQYENVIKQAGTQKKSIIFDFRKTYPAYIILVLFLAASFGVRYFSHKSVEQSTKADFDKAVSSIMTRMNNQVVRHEQILTSIKGLYGQGFEIVKDYFELYGAVPAKTYSSIISLAYVPKVTSSEWENFHFYARSSSDFNYELSPVGKRSLYYPALYVVINERNRHRLGFDYATIPDVKRAIEKAENSKNMTATSIFNVRKDTSGLCLIAPIFDYPFTTSANVLNKNYLQAALILEINAKAFFNSALIGNSGEVIPTDSTVLFEFVEGNEANSKIAFRSLNFGLLNSGYEPAYTDKITLRIADRDFVGVFYTVPNFGGSMRAYLPTIAFLASLAISFIFFGFVISVITSRARAEDLAEKMTRSQRRIMEATKDIIGVFDFSGVWRSVNPAVLDVLGFQPEELYSLQFDSLFANSDDVLLFKNLTNISTNEHTEKLTNLMTTKSGKQIWVNWSLTVSTTERLIYAIGRDVTLEKLAEQEAEIKRKQIEIAEHFAHEASQSKSYFMIKLSHQLRNSLTGILGYLQLLSMKVYETEEEHDSYLQFAEQSSEEIFTFVSDIVEATIDSSASSLDNFVNTKVSSVLRKAMNVVREREKIEKIECSLDESAEKAAALVNPELLKESLVHILHSLISDKKDVVIDATIQENHYEGATEIQLLGPGNAEVAEMITLYKENSTKIIEIIRFDKKDIINNLAKAASLIRRMNGTMTVETFGGEDGNVVMLTLPFVKK